MTMPVPVAVAAVEEIVKPLRSSVTWLALMRIDRLLRKETKYSMYS